MVTFQFQFDGQPLIHPEHQSAELLAHIRGPDRAVLTTAKVCNRLDRLLRQNFQHLIITV